ncbi:uncharacterized protein Tco025E_00085 [Trypanosoma conorhini]|uniref:Uncharacterized protein n=1 Tax=Trypanosoma conorhini TaxID=83891 RepID=A0A3R7PMN9_9TRYP|nr:uncharacterized protein Tco025E_00085 [Trypanosoma conorhini]RNF27701.1 hypothetical protein Tco025E_00085 [Trypanosoma conorhini]
MASLPAPGRRASASAGPRPRSGPGPCCTCVMNMPLICRLCTESPAASIAGAEADTPGLLETARAAPTKFATAFSSTAPSTPVVDCAVGGDDIVDGDGEAMGCCGSSSSSSARRRVLLPLYDCRAALSLAEMPRKKDAASWLISSTSPPLLCVSPANS